MTEKHKIEFCNGQRFGLEGGNDIIFIDFQKERFTADTTLITADNTIITADNFATTI